ncbi:MAG TPA: metalloregulator ArsR/SmtB family transcription factor [Thermomicrobiales bacterium]|nr:metalloregulator ArsR/SmtB family transcription factor [Thermomicrobiales bacterium]
MGELVVGRPALKLQYHISAPLDLVSGMALLYRAVPGSGLDQWLITARRSLTPEVQADLDLLHGFSGRMLVYMEEPVWTFQPLSVERRDASIADLVAFLHDLEPVAYLDMVERALGRVHRELKSGAYPPRIDDEAGWRTYLEPALTTALIDDVLRLIRNPSELKQRTISLIEGVWNQVLGAAFEQHQAELTEAVYLASRTTSTGFAPTFVELTENRLPSPLVAGVHDVECVTFCPSNYLGPFVSYTIYPPDLVVYFSAPLYLARTSNGHLAEPVPTPAAIAEPCAILGSDDVLETLRALSDPNRLRIIELLSAGELYAQEVVGRLGIAQSAVSRHLALLERASVITVRPHGGMKYYALNCARMDALAETLRQCSR